MDARKLRIYVAQMDVHWENKEKNRVQCMRIAELAAKAKADMVVFPEMTLTGFSVSNAYIAENPADSPSVDFFKKLARQTGVAIVFGVVFQTGRKRKNMALVVDHRGKIIAQYQKMHNFRLGGEDAHFVPGQDVTFFSINGFKIAPVICYDLRFGGLFEVLSKHHPDAIVVIANWPKVRIAHWRLLLPARALDTQSYIIGVNRVGHGDTSSYDGFSSVYSPSGEKLLELHGAKGKSITLEKAVISKIRKTFSSLADKRHQLYSRF